MSRKPYVRPLPRTSWYLLHSRYMRYMAREVTCIFIGAYTAVLLVGIKRLSEGPVAYQAFVDSLNTPLSIIFHLIAFAFTIYHTTSWFNVTPKAMRIQIGQDFAPGAAIVGAHYAGWVIVSLVVLMMAGV